MTSYVGPGSLSFPTIKSFVCSRSRSTVLLTFITCSLACSPSLLQAGAYMWCCFVAKNSLLKDGLLMWKTWCVCGAEGTELSETLVMQAFVDFGGFVSRDSEESSVRSTNWRQDRIGTSRDLIFVDHTWAIGTSWHSKYGFCLTNIE